MFRLFCLRIEIPINRIPLLADRVHYDRMVLCVGDCDFCIGLSVQIGRKNSSENSSFDILRNVIGKRNF